ncbi:MAG: ferrous iron transport protein B [Firmicutes bacterium]|nr:ferrous iron transport protein B [Bacillota bacterium]
MPVIALAGNPNAGKTALFNAITGARHHVGNWPGVTVEKKEGFVIMDDKQALIIDLPGIYAFSSRAIDETIARDFIIDERPDVVINVVDSTNLERNLYLTLQLLEMGVPVIIALNMFDEAEALGLDIDVDRLSALLGVEVVPTVAVDGQGVDELLETAFKAASHSSSAESAVTASSCCGGNPFRLDYGPVVEAEIASLEKYLVQNTANMHSAPRRWFAVKLLEKNQGIAAKIKAQSNGSVGTSGALSDLETEVAAAQARILEATGQEPADLITQVRYNKAAEIAQAVIGRYGAGRRSVSELMDRIALHRWLAYPVFFGIIWLMFNITFTVSEPIAQWFGGAFELLSDWVRGILVGIGTPQLLVGFLVDGIMAGVGAVLEFAPPIFLLFLVISILEDVGYMARAALLSDRFMRSVGLHGKAFIPMILGFGCNVTGILATRNLDNPKDRLISIMVNPLISCAGRLPVYVLFAAAFFERRQGLVVFSLYLLGVLLAALAAKVIGMLIEPGEASTFVMELPPYRVPRLSAVLLHTWERGKEFLYKAGTIILAGVAVVWLLANLPPGTDASSSDSLIGMIGRSIAPILRPAGFGNWQAAVALIFGIVAKEMVIGTLGVLYGVGEMNLLGAIQSAWTPLSAYAYMVMTLIYVPCIATIAAIRRETGSWKWTAITVAYTLTLGWILAVLVYQVGTVLGLS